MPIGIHSANMATRNELTNQAVIVDANAITKGSWLSNSEELGHIQHMKDLALGNCRLLYGSERFKFYDIVLCENEENGAFASLLTCNQNGDTKILRNEVEARPVEAVRKMVERLQRDTAKLFTKYTVGCQITGQQGITDAETGKFKLWKHPNDYRRGYGVDDTRGLIKNDQRYGEHNPWQTQTEHQGNKRRREEGSENGFRKDNDESRHRASSEEGEIRTNSGLDYGGSYLDQTV